MLHVALAIETGRHNSGCLLWLLSSCMLPVVQESSWQQLRAAFLWCVPWMCFIVLSEPAA